MKKFIKEWGFYIFLIIVILLFKRYIFTTVRVSGTSMYDTLLNGDIMILNRIDNDYKRFDIVVAHYDELNEDIIKRIIGLPGEKIEYKDNVLYIDGVIYNDKYNSIEQGDFSIRLQDDEYFLMGDNREVSLDSRKLGPFKKDKLKGHASLVIYPFNRFGNKN